VDDVPECKTDLAQAKARKDSKEVKYYQGCLTDDKENIKRLTALKAELERAAYAAVDALDEGAVVEQVVSPDGGEEHPVSVNAPKTDLPVFAAEDEVKFLMMLPRWLLKFLKENPKEVKSARWIAIGEGSVPEIGDNAMLMTNPDNAPPSKAQEKRAAKKGLSKQKMKKIANKKASKAAAGTMHNASVLSLN
jgi:hypothetical protein